MAENRRFLDVWIVESNTVYREVPFTVVVDWVQQGRLLEDDQLRPSGTEKWHKLGTTPALAAYLPHSDPMRAEDQAEALEPVELDFQWKRGRGDEDDDPDMIPLIDISLVLLIFFMMTSTVVVAASRINVPDVENGSTLAAPDMIWIGIDRKPDGSAIYSIGEGEKGAPATDQNLTAARVIERFAERTKGAQEKVEVRITADRALPYKVVKELTFELQKTYGNKIKVLRAEVGEKKP